MVPIRINAEGWAYETPLTFDHVGAHCSGIEKDIDDMIV